MNDWFEAAELDLSVNARKLEMGLNKRHEGRPKYRYRLEGREVKNDKDWISYQRPP